MDKYVGKGCQAMAVRVCACAGGVPVSVCAHVGLRECAPWRVPHRRVCPRQEGGVSWSGAGRCGELGAGSAGTQPQGLVVAAGFVANQGLQQQKPEGQTGEKPRCATASPQTAMGTLNLQQSGALTAGSWFSAWKNSRRIVKP